MHWLDQMHIQLKIPCLSIVKMGIVTCVAYKCGNKRIPGANSGVKFYGFPKDKIFCRKWEIATKLKEFK